MAYPFRQVFEPVAGVGQNIKAIPEWSPKAGYYRIDYVEPLHKIVKDFGALAAAGESGDTEITDAYMPDNVMAQYRVLALDDIDATVKQPLGSTRYVTDTLITTISRQTHQIEAPGGQRNEIFVIEDEKVYFNVKNNGGYKTYRNRLLLIGFKFLLTPLTEEPAKWVPVPVAGTGRRGAV